MRVFFRVWVRALLSLAITRVNTRSEPGSSTVRVMISSGSLLGPLPTKRSGSPKADFRPCTSRCTSHRERERLTTLSPSSSCQ